MPVMDTERYKYLIDYLISVEHSRRDAFLRWLGADWYEITTKDLAQWAGLPYWTVASWRNETKGEISDLGLNTLRWYEDLHPLERWRKHDKNFNNSNKNNA